MVFVAMYMSATPAMQILIFVFCSAGMCFFIGWSWPFQSSSTNVLELFNEIMILAVGILAMAQIGVVKESDVEQGYALGNVISGIIIF